MPGLRPIRLLVLGDSTAAGVGADSQADALPGNLAHAILGHYGRGTEWEAIGRNDSTARDLIVDYLPEATSRVFDLVFLTVGANDALGLRSRGAFRRDVRVLVDRVRTSSPGALILVSLMPRFDRFASLHNPVRWNLSLHAASLDDGARRAVVGMADVFATPKPAPYTPEFWASDGSHPGAEGYRRWIDFAIDAMPDALLSKHFS